MKYELYTLTAVQEVDRVFLDIETDLINKDYSIAGQTRQIILVGTRQVRTGRKSIYTPEYIPSFTKDRLLLIGHNISYDIIQMCKSFPEFYTNIKNFTYMIWDTALFEHMKYGQSFKYPSLEECLTRRELKVTKDKGVSDLIKSGICPSEIYKVEPDRLTKYLERDLEATEQLFTEQWIEFNTFEKKTINLYLQRMQFLHTTILMSLNGMPFDTLQAVVAATDIRDQLQSLEEALRIMMESDLPHLASGQLYTERLNPGSNDQVAWWLYGGEIALDIQESVGFYKTGRKAGQEKFRKTKIFVPTAQKVAIPIGHMGVSEAELLEMKKAGCSVIAAAFIDDLLKYRHLKKELTTYYESYIEFTNPDGRVRCDYNHTSTHTGRISSSKPNLQNVVGD